MFQISVEAEFSAAHAIMIRGVREPLHGHNWRVVATFEADHLDSEGLLLDFHAAQRSLASAVGTWNNSNLNDAPEFARLNPTAENVARVICGSLAADLEPLLRSTPARIVRVEVSEAAGCVAAFLPGQEPDR